MHGHSQQLGGRRFAVFGDGRLAGAVSAEFERRGAAAEPITYDDIETRLPDPGLECFVAVAEKHEANLRAALHASKHAPDLPVVIRAFDPELAEEVERKRDGDTFRVRGAYSVAHLAAPDFVAAALLGEDERNEVTLRLADQYVNVCRTHVRAAPRSRAVGTSRLAGRTPAEVFARHRCQVLARRTAGDPWALPGPEPLRDGERSCSAGGCTTCSTSPAARACASGRACAAPRRPSAAGTRCARRGGASPRPGRTPRRRACACCSCCSASYLPRS
jgi:hypothetical protein